MPRPLSEFLAVLRIQHGESGSTMRTDRSLMKVGRTGGRRTLALSTAIKPGVTSAGSVTDLQHGLLASPSSYEGKSPSLGRQWGRPARPGVWWATLGGAVVLFELYLFARWMAAGNATPVTRGAASAPSWILDVAWLQTALGAVAFAGFVWWYLVRPWRSDRTITTDGLLMIACMTTYWCDLSANYLKYVSAYPTVWPNLGSWYNFIPGWSSPNGQLLPEAEISFLPLYAVVMFGFTGFGCAAMRRVRAKRPAISKWQLFAVAWLTMGLIDLVAEVGWVRLQLFVYPVTIPTLTIFPGRVYQFPVYESVIWGFGWAILCALRFFRNEKDETMVEKGLQVGRNSKRHSTLLRFLAIVGVCNLTLVGYNAVFGLVSMQGSSDWPSSFTSRPYIVGNICGPHAQYACPTAHDGR
jgi:hypothetical protein